MTGAGHECGGIGAEDPCCGVIAEAGDSTNVRTTFVDINSRLVISCYCLEYERQRGVASGEP